MACDSNHPRCVKLSASTGMRFLEVVVGLFYTRRALYTGGVGMKVRLLLEFEADPNIRRSLGCWGDFGNGRTRLWGVE